VTAPSVISKLMRPASVAVIGASANAGKTAGRPIAYLQKQGFAGSIYPVNPNADEIAGLKSYPNIASLPETPDVGIILLGVERAHLAVRELAACRCPAAIVLGSGYGETGEAGLARQKELMKAAGRMRILGPNTIGVVNLTDGIPLSASGALAMSQFPTGGISLVSQSGGILGSLLSHAAARRIGHSKLVSTGNEVDLDLADFLDWLADDPDTKVIALYVEAIRDAAKFRAAALKAVRAGKPIVAFKVGRSEAGSRAVVSHTGALAGADRSYDALFAQSGVIRAERFTDLLDIPAALAAGRRLSGNRIAILTSTGGVAALVSDSLGVAGFDMPAPDAATASKLRALQTGAHAVLDRNPVDVTLAGLEPKLLSGAINALLESPSYDAIVVIVGSSSLAMPDLMAGTIRGCLPGSDKPVLAYVSPYAPDIVGLLNASGVPAFTTPESVTAALAAMLKKALARQPRPPGRGLPAWREPPPALAAPAANIDLAAFGAGVLDEQRSKQLFAAFGIAVAREIAVTDGSRAEQAARELGGKVALKVVSEKIAHKSEAGGVAINLTADDIAARLARMTQEVAAGTALTPDRFLVQQMVTGGREMILGLKRDPLGVVVLLGAGGTAAELMGDTSIRLLMDGAALARDEAMAMIRELRSWPLLDGYRGRPKADVEALVDAIVAFSAMAARLGDRLGEAEINPLFVLDAGQGVVAADGLAVLR
jgi:acetate---CoA ligase (ADP-forming)